MKELDSIEKLIDSLSLFPTVGTKSAERMAYALLDMENDEVELLVKHIQEVKSKIHQCPKCGALTEHDVCSICSNETRDHQTVIVVAEPRDIFSFEKLQKYDGVYHVLNGLINFSKNITPDKLTINKLIARVDEENIKEIIIATPGTPDGEITALFIAKLLEDKEVKVTRLGYGMPMGSNFEYIDSLTIERALKNRTNIKD